MKTKSHGMYLIMILVIGITAGLWTPRLIESVHANYMDKQIQEAEEEIEHLGYDWQTLEQEKQDLLERIEEINQEQAEFHRQADEIRAWINSQKGLIKSR